MSVGGGLGAQQFFCHLKRTLELFISVRMSPLETFYDRLVETMTPEKKKRTGDRSSGKKYDVPHFCS